MQPSQLQRLSPGADVECAGVWPDSDLACAGGPWEVSERLRATQARAAEFAGQLEAILPVRRSNRGAAG